MEAHKQIKKQQQQPTLTEEERVRGEGGSSAAGGKEREKGIEMVMEIGHDLQRSVARAVEQEKGESGSGREDEVNGRQDFDRARAREVWSSGGSGCEIGAIDADAGIRTCCVCFAFFAVGFCCCLLWLLLLLSLLHLMAAIMASFTFCLEGKRLAWPSLILLMLAVFG